MNRVPDNAAGAGTAVTGRHRAILRQAAGYLLAAACLVWVFHDVEIEALWRVARSLNWMWAVAAVAVDVASYACQGWRWSLLLKPQGKIGTFRSTQAIYVGLFLNELLPLRVGELARLFLAARWLKEPVAKIVPSAAVERLFDGLWLAAGIGLTAIFVPLPRNLLDAADALGMVILAATAVFGWLILRRREQTQPKKAAGGWLGNFLTTLTAGIAKIGLSRAFWAALLISFLFLFLQAAAFWLVMLAAGMKLTFWQGFAVLLIVHLGTAIPNAPANVGSYQFFVVAGLMLFGVEKPMAAGFSVVVFVILTVPLWALGWAALRATGIEFAAMREEVRKWKHAGEP